MLDALLLLTAHGGSVTITQDEECLMVRWRCGERSMGRQILLSEARSMRDPDGALSLGLRFMRDEAHLG